MTNPLLSPWTTQFEMPPFALITDADFAPAFETALAQAKENINNIANNTESPTFANTIDALELAEVNLERVLGVFYNVAGADSNEERQELQREFAPQLAKYGAEIAMNEPLFTRIDHLWNSQDSLSLSHEQARVLKLTRRSMIRSGAALKGDDRVRLAEILAELARLGTRFSQMLLADEATWIMPLEPDEVTGLPRDLVAGLAAAAKERGKEGYVLTTARSLMTPFLQFCPNRALREKAFAGWAERGARGDKNDTRKVSGKILQLRHERAVLLGYDDFAGFKLETEMAKTPEAVRELLQAVWAPAKSAALSDAGILQDMLSADGINDTLAQHDWRYYSEIRRKKEHDLDEAELKPYFQLDRLIEAAFSCSTRLFNLSFEPLEVPLYHSDARAWNVKRGGQHIAVFIGDYFARPSKRSGAWCSAMRAQSKLNGDVRPIVVNVCNFAKPAQDQAALLAYDDARTLFHEFGHALHQMLSNVTYPSISGTSVARDFVELPSQLYEHWLDVPSILSEFATHADTGEPIPDALRDRLLNARTYDTGFSTVEFLSSALVDLGFHTGKPPADLMDAQKATLDDIGMPDAIAMRHATPHFSHVFSGDGYAAGYYSYMWSEIMDADAFAAFEEAGDPFDADLARSLEANILSAGGSDDPETLYQAFRGRMPEIGPLLKGRGLA